MIAADILFSEFAPSEAKLINQALRATLGQIDSQTTLFYAYGARDDVPTKAEIDHATEVIGYALDYQVIPYGAEQFITDAFRFIAWDIQVWVEGRPTGQTPEESLLDYSRVRDVDADKNTVAKLSYLARRICPQGEIFMDYTATVLPSDKYLTCCRKALEQLLAPAPLGTLEYNAYLGIVVDGVIYNIPRIHPVAGKLLKAIEEYQDHTYQEGEWLENKATGSSR